MNAFRGCDQSHEEFMRRYVSFATGEPPTPLRRTGSAEDRLWRYRVCGAGVGDEPGNDLEAIDNDDLHPSPNVPVAGDEKRIRRTGSGRRKITQRNRIWRSAWNRFSKPTAPEATHWSDLETAAKLLERVGYRRRFLRKPIRTNTANSSAGSVPYASKPMPTACRYCVSIPRRRRH